VDLPVAGQGWLLWNAFLAAGSRLILPWTSRSQALHLVADGLRLWAPVERLFATVRFERATERSPYVRLEPDEAADRVAASSRASRILMALYRPQRPNAL
jgi:hypothetical protein